MVDRCFGNLIKATILFYGRARWCPFQSEDPTPQCSSYFGSDLECMLAQKKIMIFLVGVMEITYHA